MVAHTTILKITASHFDQRLPQAAGRRDGVGRCCIMRFTKWDYVAFPFLAALLLGAFFGALLALGFFGVGILGLIILLITIRIDLDADVPGSGLVSQTRMWESLSPSEKAEMSAVRNRRRQPLFIAQIVATGFIILGFGLQFLL